MDIRPFNLGFKFWGPHEYCDTGEFVDAKECKATITYLKKEIQSKTNLFEYYADLSDEKMQEIHYYAISWKMKKIKQTNGLERVGL